MKSHSKNNNITKRLLSFAMLMLYVMAFFLTPSFEHHHHDTDEDHLCTVENEVDPCHRVIFHQDVQQGCQHEEHFIAHHESCEVCDKLLTVHPKLMDVWADAIVLYGSDFTQVVANKVLTNSTSQQKFARGPPMLA
jgi:hypothetical protein